ncbi:MAG: VOC family protein [Pyrinomonadaceae bacterium]|nr:VOC family protein [Pyrinomonadaceae bacterium]
MKKEIYPCLWFDGKAKEAMSFYVDVFGNSKITEENPIVVNVEVCGQKFMGLNGGPQFKINPSISFMVQFDTESETEAAWHKLIEGGSAIMGLDKYEWSPKYGWVQDKFGVSWQLITGKKEDFGQKFSPTLMFTGEQCGRAEESVKFYTSLFENSKIDGILKYSLNDADREDLVKHSQFTLNGNVFMAMDSSHLPQFAFNEGISFVVECDTQDEIDYFWSNFTADGGQESMCGWLKDKFGVSWQIVPSILGELIRDPERGQRVMNAFLKMKKFEIEKLLNA